MNGIELIDGVEVELKEKIDLRINRHRNDFFQMIQNRYREMLPMCITYSGIITHSIDFIKVEVALRNGLYPVIGKTNNNKVMFLGYVKTNLSINNPDNFYDYDILNENDIHFTIPESYRLSKMQEITELDNCQSGEFVVVRNKVLNYTNDFNIIRYYAEEIAEIVTSRFSLIMQAKFQTIFQGAIGDETINQIIADMYNGSPYIKTSQLFDPDEQIIKIDNPNLSINLDTLKKEYQNKISELNNILGINSLAVDKESGVSDAEAKSNQAFITTNANIYLKSRQSSIDRLNKRFSLDIEVKYDDKALSELSEVNINSEQDNYNNI